MHRVVSRPSVPEEGDGDEAGEEDAGWETHLGLENVVVGFGHADYGFVADCGDGGDAEEESDADAEVGEARDLGGPFVLLLEEGRDGCEHEVEKAVDDGHVEGHEPRDGGEEEHLEWADEAVAEGGGCWRQDMRLLVARAELRLVKLNAEFLRLMAHQHAVVGLFVEHLDHDGDQCGRDQENPVHPSPARTLRDETTADWTDDWTEERAERENGRCETALIRLEEIRDHAAADSNASRATNTGEEAEDDQCLDVWC